MNEVKKNWTKWLFWFLFAVALIAIYKTLDSFGYIVDFIRGFMNIIAPILAGVLIAYLFYIPTRGVEGWLKKAKNNFIISKARTLSILIVYAIALLIVVLIVNVIMPVVLNSIIDLAGNLQGYYNSAVETINNLPEDSILKSDIVKTTIDGLKNIDLTQYINASDIGQYAKGVLSVAGTVFDIFVALVVSVYLLAERSQILQFIKKLVTAIFNPKAVKNLGKYFNSTNQIFYKFLAGQFMDAIIVGILATVAMSIMGIKYAALLGFMIGLFNMIPYFGAIIAVAVAALITLISGGLSQAIWMIIVVVILQQIDANIINPKILGNTLKISPLIVIVAVLIGGAYFGVIGMFLAVPIAAALKIIVMDLVDYKIKKKKEKGEIQEETSQVTEKNSDEKVKSKKKK